MGDGSVLVADARLGSVIQLDDDEVADALHGMPQDAAEKSYSLRQATTHLAARRCDRPVPKYGHILAKRERANEYSPYAANPIPTSTTMIAPPGAPSRVSTAPSRPLALSGSAVMAA